MVLTGPIIGIILDERLLVLGDGVTLHDPFDGRFAVDDILVGFLRDVLDGDVAVIDDHTLIVLRLEAHFIYHAEVLDDNYQPTKSKTFSALLANEIAGRLGITNKWKVFEKFWNRKDMYQDYHEAVNQKQSPENMRTVYKLFN